MPSDSPRRETAGQRVAHRFHVGIQRLVRREEGKCAEGDSNENVYNNANAAAGYSRTGHLASGSSSAVRTASPFPRDQSRALQRLLHPCVAQFDAFHLLELFVEVPNVQVEVLRVGRAPVTVSVSERNQVRSEMEEWPSG
jgi:hypothetical protein